MAAEALAQLTLEERNRVRYHLGYGNADPVVTLALGFPTRTEKAFLVDAAMDHIPASAIGDVRAKIGFLDQLEERQKKAVDRLSVLSVEDVTFNPDELDKLEKELARWAMKLADYLGVPVNQYATRFRLAGPPSLNLRVVT